MSHLPLSFPPPPPPPFFLPSFFWSTDRCLCRWCGCRSGVVRSGASAILVLSTSTSTPPHRPQAAPPQQQQDPTVRHTHATQHKRDQRGNNEGRKRRRKQRPDMCVVCCRVCVLCLRVLGCEVVVFECRHCATRHPLSAGVCGVLCCSYLLCVILRA